MFPFLLFKGFQIVFLKQVFTTHLNRMEFAENPPRMKMFSNAKSVFFSIFKYIFKSFAMLCSSADQILSNDMLS